MAATETNPDLEIIDSDEIEEVAANPLQDFTCERCSYKYKKQFDHQPYLCNRCMRFVAKKVWTIIHMIQPAVSAPDTERT